jgi:flagellar FliL protein
VKLAAAVMTIGSLAGLTAAAEEESAEALPEPNYLELKPSIVANLNGGPQYIRCDVQLMTPEKERLAEITLHAPALRHEILLRIPEVDGKALATHAGKEAFRRELLAAVQGVLARETGAPLVEELYFTSFYVQ